MTVRHEPTKPAQQAAYGRCIYEDAANATFVGLFDVDEFLVLHRHGNAIDFLEEHCSEECGQLSINWRTMGASGGAGYRPVPVTRWNVHTEALLATTVKTIVRPGYVADDGVKWVHTVDLKRGHWVDTSGRRHPQKPGWEDMYGRLSNTDRPADVAVLHHYKFKSAGELRYKKCIRGRVNAGGRPDQCQKASYDVGIDAKYYNDDAWEQLKRMVPKYALYQNAVSKLMVDRYVPI